MSHGTTPLRRDTGEAKATVAIPKSKACSKAKGGCGERFKPARGLQAACSPACAQSMAETKRLKAERAADKVKREKLEPRSYWEKLAERQVNRYVRLRDARLGCISCDKPASWDGRWTASHYRSVGAATAVRFNLWNIHKACAQCNLFLSGNLSAYEPRIREKIGAERVEWLKAQNQIVRYEIEYLKRLKTVFNRKANRLAKRLGCA